MALTMSEKKSVTAEFHKQYSESLKKQTNEILGEFTILTGCNGNYVARILLGNSPQRKNAL